MLFKEEDIQLDPLVFLDSAVYLNQMESKLHPQMVPVIENARLGHTTVRFDYVMALQETNGIGIDEALKWIATANQADTSSLRLVVDETDMILNPSISSLVEDIVIAPLSTNDPVYQFCKSQSEAYLDSLDEAYLIPILEVGIGSNGDPNESNRFLHQLAYDAGKMFGTNDPFHVRDEIAKMPGMNSRFDTETGEKWTQNHLIRNLAFHLNPVAKAVRGTSNGTLGKLKDIKDNAFDIIKAGWKQSKNPFTAGQKWAGATRDAIEAHFNSGLNDKSSGGEYTQGDVLKRMGQSALVGTILHPVTLGGMAIGAGALAAKGLPALAKKVQDYRNRPKSVIAKKIAALRRIYQEWMNKARQSKDSGIASKLKKASAALLSVIDRLLAFLQQKSDRR